MPAPDARVAIGARKSARSRLARALLRAEAMKLRALASASAIASASALAACSGSSGNADVANGGSAGHSCASPSAVLAPGIDPNDTTLAVSSDAVFYRHVASTNSVLVRVPLDGSATQTIAAGDDIRTFAVSASGALVWATRPPSTPAQPTPPSTAPTGPVADPIQLRDATGATQPLALPTGASVVHELAIDGAGNVFVIADVAIQGFGNGEAVWRWSATRKTFDQLQKEPAGLRGVLRDGDGMTWQMTTKEGATELVHEDVTGGTPVMGVTFTLPSDAAIIGLDAAKAYYASGLHTIGSVDRATGASTTEVSIVGTELRAPSNAFVDDAHLYWMTSDATTQLTTVWRIAKGAGASATPEAFATGAQLEAPQIGDCAVAFLGIAKEGDAWGIMTKPR